MKTLAFSLFQTGFKHVSDRFRTVSDRSEVFSDPFQARVFFLWKCVHPACRMESLLLRCIVYPAFVRPGEKKNEKNNGFGQSLCVDLIVDACLFDA